MTSTSNRMSPLASLATAEADLAATIEATAQHLDQIAGRELEGPMDRLAAAAGRAKARLDAVLERIDHLAGTVLEHLDSVHGALATDLPALEEAMFPEKTPTVAYQPRSAAQSTSGPCSRSEPALRLVRDMRHAKE